MCVCAGVAGLVSICLYKGENNGLFLEWAADWEGTGMCTGLGESGTEEVDMMWAVRRRKRRTWT